MKTLISIMLLICFYKIVNGQISSNSVYISLNIEKGMSKSEDINGIISFQIPSNLKTGNLIFIYSRNTFDSIKNNTIISEYNKLPNNWQRVDAKQILEYVQQNQMNEFRKKDIFIVQKDKCLSIYRAYKVKWLNDAVTEE